MPLFICTLLLALFATACESPARPFSPPAGDARLASEPEPDGHDSRTDRNGSATAADEGERWLSGVSDARARAAIEATASGDLYRAHELLSEMLVERAISQGRGLIDDGSARDALPVLDRAIELNRRYPDAWFWRGRAAFVTAPTDNQPMFFYQDAMEKYEQAWRLGYGVEAVLEASAAARMANLPSKAVSFAREGMRLLEGLETRPDLRVAPERTIAEATFGAFVEKKNAGEDASQLFGETEDQLKSLAARTPDDPWVWLQLSNLYQWEERSEQAREVVERGLEFAPESIELHAREVELLRQAGGPDAVLTFYDGFRAKYPESGLGHWYPAYEVFLQGIESYNNGEDGSALFETAERSFQKARQLTPEFEQSALGYEVVCRAGVGWCRFEAGDLLGAKEAFLSMEDLLEGGLAWQFGDLRSGVVGLSRVLGEYAASPDDADKMVHAAAIADYLHSYLPEDGDVANNAGFFNRDAGVAIEILARRAAHRANLAGEEAPSAEEQRELEQEAARLRARAQELMERSYGAYQVAARLMPDDVRVVNDTGLIMTYYLRSDTEAAERYLRRAVELGAEQLATTTLEGQELDDLKEAWGDAHQNLGLLYLTLKNDPESARRWFQKSLEIGPMPRPFVENACIPACDGDEEALRAVRRQIWENEA